MTERVQYVAYTSDSSENLSCTALAQLGSQIGQVASSDAASSFHLIAVAIHPDLFNQIAVGKVHLQLLSCNVFTCITNAML